MKLDDKVWRASNHTDFIFKNKTNYPLLRVHRTFALKVKDGDNCISTQH